MSFLDHDSSLGVDHTEKSDGFWRNERHSFGRPGFDNSPLQLSH
jgi:hypothetical protein